MTPQESATPPTIEVLSAQLEAATVEIDRLLAELRVMTQQIRDLETALADQAQVNR